MARALAKWAFAVMASGWVMAVCAGEPEAIRGGSDTAMVGRVVLNGVGLPDVTVKVIDRDGRGISLLTDRFGRYLIPLGRCKVVSVTPSRAGYTFTPTSRDPGDDHGQPRSMVFFAAPERVIKVLMVGDVFLGGHVQQAIKTKGGGDYRFPFLHVADYLSRADIAFGNLEGVLTDREDECVKQLSGRLMGHCLRMDIQAVAGLKFAGFDVLSVANNHAGDYGFAGMLDEYGALKEAGIAYVGGGNDYQQAHAPVIKQIRGTRIAFLAYTNVRMTKDISIPPVTLSPFSETNKWIATAHSPGVAWAHDWRFSGQGNLENMSDDIRKARKLADLVFVSVHFGWQWHKQPDLGGRDMDREQQRLARAAIDAGAALVVGHHSHVVQWLDGDAESNAIERYNGGYIAYSTGNFIFDIRSTRKTAPRGEATRGLMLEALIDRGRIIGVNQIRTYYLDDYWQARIE